MYLLLGIFIVYLSANLGDMPPVFGVIGWTLIVYRICKAVPYLIGGSCRHCKGRGSYHSPGGTVVSNYEISQCAFCGGTGSSR